MHGNVREWVEDCWHDYDGAPNDGSAWITGDCEKRVLRGGSWLSMPESVRSAARQGESNFNGRQNNNGFRLARTLNP